MPRGGQVVLPVTALVILSLVRLLSSSTNADKREMMREIDELRKEVGGERAARVKRESILSRNKRGWQPNYPGWGDGKWYVGGQYITSTASSPVEMFNEAWDTYFVMKELGKVAAVGMNVIRVSLQEEAYAVLGNVFLERVETFLTLAARHKLSVIFTLLDSTGRQEVPTNTDVEIFSFKRYWPMSPHPEMAENRVEDYVKGVLEQFRWDKRVVAWDLWEAPTDDDLELLSKVIDWGHGVRPVSALTTSIAIDASKELEDFQVRMSEVIFFHHSGSLDTLQSQLTRHTSRSFKKPVFCAGYLTRSKDVTPLTAIPMFRNASVHSTTTGLIKGLSSLTYPRSSFTRPLVGEPVRWEHDLIEPSGIPYSIPEVEYIESLGLNLE